MSAVVVCDDEERAKREERKAKSAGEEMDWAREFFSCLKVDGFVLYRAGASHVVRSVDDGNLSNGFHHNKLTPFECVYHKQTNTHGATDIHSVSRPAAIVKHRESRPTEERCFRCQVDIYSQLDEMLIVAMQHRVLMPA